MTTEKVQANVAGKPVSAQSVIIYPKDDLGKVEIQWTTTAGQHRHKTLTQRAQRFINDRSGLLGSLTNNYFLGNGTNSYIAQRLGIPVYVLIAYQAHVGIDVKKRQVAYKEAIARAILLTRELGFPADGAGVNAIPMDPLDMFH